MIAIDIPDFGALRIEHAVFDYNGTLAVDGVPLPGVAEAVRSLALQLRVHVLTADTFGLATAQMAGWPVELTIATPGAQAEQKQAFVEALGAASVVAIGNGRNDRLMLSAAGLGIAVVQGEGASAETWAAADVVCGSVVEAIGLLLHPKRLVATLRS